MDLLKYEFFEDPEDSFNGLIGKLVKEVRHYRNEVPATEFKAAIPMMQKLEQKIQQIDSSVGHAKRFYLQEIMDELDEEGSLEEKLFDEIKRACGSILKDLFKRTFVLEEIDFSFNKSGNFFWMIFQGYKISEREKDGSLIIIKEVFRSVCNKYRVIYVDNCPA